MTGNGEVDRKRGKGNDKIICNIFFRKITDAVLDAGSSITGGVVVTAAYVGAYTMHLLRVSGRGAKMIRTSRGDGGGGTNENRDGLARSGRAVAGSVLLPAVAFYVVSAAVMSPAPRARRTVGRARPHAPPAPSPRPRYRVVQ